MAPPGDTPDTPTPLVYSQAQAASLCQVSSATIRRARQDGRLPNSTPDGSGGWRILATDLIAAGLLTRAAAPPDTGASGGVSPKMEPLHMSGDIPPVTPHGTRDTAPDTARELTDLRARLAAAEQRAAVAEALAIERERALERADVMLRMLEAGRVTPPRVTVEEPPFVADEPAPRPWWRRLTGR